MELQLAAKLGVSRTPIREAIRMLEQEGACGHNPKGRGGRQNDGEGYGGCPTDSRCVR